MLWLSQLLSDKMVFPIGHLELAASWLSPEVINCQTLGCSWSLLPISILRPWHCLSSVNERCRCLGCGHSMDRCYDQDTPYGLHAACCFSVNCQTHETNKVLHKHLYKSHTSLTNISRSQTVFKLVAFVLAQAIERSISGAKKAALRGTAEAVFKRNDYVHHCQRVRLVHISNRIQKLSLVVLPMLLI